MHIFLTILAWVGVVIGGLYFIINLIAQWNYYGSYTEAQDQFHGKKVSYKKAIIKGFIILVICIAYLIAFPNDTLVF